MRLPITALLLFIIMLSFVSAEETAENSIEIKDPFISVHDQKLKSVLNHHMDAIGGWENWQKIFSLRLSGQITKDRKTIDFVFIKKRPNFIRATLTLEIPGNEKESIQKIRAHDGRNAWSATRLSGDTKALQKKPLHGSDADDLLTDACVETLLIKLSQSGAVLKICKPGKVNGIYCHVIEATSDLFVGSYRFYLSNVTFHILRTEHLHPQKGDTVTDFSNYQMCEGVYLPMRHTIYSEQTGVTVLVTQSAQVGVGIYEDYFNFIPLNPIENVSDTSLISINRSTIAGN